MITLCGCQGRIVRDLNLTRDGFIVVIYVLIRINIDAAATALALFTRPRSSAHKPADGEVRMIPNVQVTAIIDAQAAAALRDRLYIGDVHGFAVVQSQCAGAKEYRRDIGTFSMGVAGVLSRFDSQRRAVLDGHFAVGRIDAQIVQRELVFICCIYGDILPIVSSITRTDKLQALVIQLQILLQRNGSIAACGGITCSGNRVLQRRILGTANLSHTGVNNTGIYLFLVAIAFLVGPSIITAAGRRIFLRILVRIPVRISVRISVRLHGCLAVDSLPIRKAWFLRKGRGCKIRIPVRIPVRLHECLAADSLPILKVCVLCKGRGCKSRKRKAGCSRKYEQPFSHKYHS